MRVSENESCRAGSIGGARVGRRTELGMRRIVSRSVMNEMSLRRAPSQAGQASASIPKVHASYCTLRITSRLFFAYH